MATDAGCIGFTGTNARPSIAPTFGVEPCLGTFVFPFLQIYRLYLLSTLSLCKALVSNLVRDIHCCLFFLLFTLSELCSNFKKSFPLRPIVPGTNPLCFGIPTDEEFPFVIDCATSINQRGA